MNRHSTPNPVWMSVIAALAVGCCEAGMPPQFTSRPFEIAQSLYVPDLQRVDAAQKLNESEHARLLSVILARLPGRWDEATADDLYVLSKIGDEGTARKLEQMYPDVPDTTAWSNSMPQILHDTVARIRNRLNTHAFEIAADPIAIGNERLHAALRLNDPDRRRLQSLLLERFRLPHSSAGREGDLDVLAAIGDEEAAKAIETFYYEPPRDLGSFNTLIRFTLRQIRTREGPTTRKRLGPQDEDELLNDPG
jgi:hypothetical protein